MWRDVFDCINTGLALWELVAGRLDHCLQPQLSAMRACCLGLQWELLDSGLRVRALVWVRTGGSVGGRPVGEFPVPIGCSGVGVVWTRAVSVGESVCVLICEPCK